MATRVVLRSCPFSAATLEVCLFLPSPLFTITVFDCLTAAVFHNDCVSHEALCLWSCRDVLQVNGKAVFIHHCYRLISCFVCLLPSLIFCDGCSVCRTKWLVRNDPNQVVQESRILRHCYSDPLCLLYLFGLTVSGELADKCSVRALCI